MAEANWSYLDGPNPNRAFPGATAGARMSEQLPTVQKLVRGSDGVLRAAGSFGAKAARVAGPVAGGALAVGGEAMGVMEKVNDPNATGLDVAQRAAEGVGRLGAMGVGTGLGAAGGSVFGPVGTAIGATLGGAAGYFAPNAVYAARDWWRNRGANPAALARAPAAVGPLSAATPDIPIDPNAGTPEALAEARAVNAGRIQPIAPWTQADLRNGATADVPARVPEAGTGAIQVGRGAVRTLDFRGAGEGGVTDTRTRADITGRTANGLPNIGGFFGATAALRNIAQDNARKAALAKTELQYGGTSEQRRAQAENERLRTLAAQAHLITHPGDFSGMATVAAGRALPADQFTFLPTMNQNQVDVGAKRTGAIERVNVQARPTENDVIANMKQINPATKKPFTREEVLTEWRRRGINVGGFGATR